MQNYDSKAVEKEIMTFWEGKKIPQKIVEMDPKRKKFYLLDGPPYVNGVPHVGHVKTIVFKDVWAKFKHMQGHAVWFQPGFDCSGLPIENAVEKKLGIKSKHDIMNKVGLDKFIEECKSMAEGNKDVWMNLYRDLAAWKGWLEPYMTYKNYYLESGWWTLKKIHEKGLLVSGQRPGFWCPHCETTLSGYEVTDSYADLEEHSVFVKFPVKGEAGVYLLVWTTTPWTLPANVVVCVHPMETYVRAKVGDETLILAKKRLEILTQLDMGYTVLDEFRGERLSGLRYEPLLDTPSQKKLSEDPKAHQVVLSIPILKQRVASKVAAKRTSKKADEFGHIVTMDTGSGLVHIAPGHGDVDNKLGKQYGIPEPSPVDEQGKLTEEAGEFAGKYVKDADPLIIEKLRQTGRLLQVVKIKHSYPLCWRCKAPLIYRMSRQWYLKIDPVREGMLRDNKEVNWLPPFAQERFHKTVEEAPDWAVTRQRFWGIPIPVWTCKSCGHQQVFGSRKELSEASSGKVKADIDLHKNVVDKIILPCKCGAEMAREPDIMDVWFDSGISPWASLGYPYENKAVFERLWPVDLIDESSDQIRGWFYSLMFSSQALFGKKPYETVCLNGWTLDEKGEKMSKSLGNVILASDAHRDLGTDMLRFYYCWDIAPWETQKFSMRSARELKRVLEVLWNTCQYIETYTDLSLMGKKAAHMLPEDKWITSKADSAVKKATEDLENFRFHHYGRGVAEFMLNDLSRWYIKLIRNRMSPWYEGKDKESAQITLLEVFGKTLKLMAPLAPFITEALYQRVFAGKRGHEDSIHLSMWPEAGKPDKAAEEGMEIVKVLVEAMNADRDEKKIKLKWPVSEVRVFPTDKKVEKAVEMYASCIKSIANVHEVKLTKEAEGRDFEHGKFTLGAVLKEQALLRELSREIQMARKTRGMKVNEKITLAIETDETACSMLKPLEKELLFAVGGSSVSFGAAGKPDGSIEFEGSRLSFSFRKC